MNTVRIGREVTSVLRAATAESGDERVGDLVRFLVLGSRGGATRKKILAVLLRCPQNAHRICQTLCLNYGTVASHLRVLERFGLVTAIGTSRYNRGYSISPLLRESRTVVDLIRDVNVR
jgi:predicted transcriptional regulator